MALTYPLALGVLSDVIRYGAVRGPFLRRFDELSGSGDGRRWAAEMAPPLWAAEIDLAAVPTDAEARAVQAKIDALGADQTFLFTPPQYSGPASGMTAGLGAVTISGIRADRGGIALAGLPVGFVLSVGDYLSINHTGGRIYFGVFAEGGTAASDGTIAQREIRPYLPLGIATGAMVELVRPRFKASVESFTPFATWRRAARFYAYDASITILQKP